MYHPAAALHQASLRETLFADIRSLPETLLMAREAVEAEWAASVKSIEVEAPQAAEASPDDSQLTLF
jgi:hypothetical protein